jgi:hypothetical protein
LRLNIFLLFLAVFAVTAAGHIYTIDSYLNYTVTKSIGSRATLAIPRFMMTVEGKGGRHYSKLGIGQSLAALPLYWLGSLAEHRWPANAGFRAYSREFMIPHGEQPVRAEPQTLIRISDEDGAAVFFVSLTNAFVAAGLCLMFWLVLRRFGLSPAAALGGTSLLALATPVWVYARDLFSEPLFALSLLGSFYFLADPMGFDRLDPKERRRRLLYSVLFSSAGILARLSFLPLVAVFAVYLVVSSGEKRQGLRRAGTYVAGCLPVLGLVALLNFRRFGGPALTGYHTAFDKGFSIPLLEGLRWNTLSPYRSIFLYAPPVALFFLGLVGFVKKHRGQLLLAASIIIYVFLIYSKWWAWHGGWCWGPRFLVPIVPLMLLPGLAVMPESRRWLLPATLVLGAAGFVIQASAVIINYTAIYDYWIKIGRLDWAEAGIQRFSPIATHLQAVVATRPGHYDLWVVQAARVGSAAAWVWLLGFGAVIGVTLTRILRGEPR